MKIIHLKKKITIDINNNIIEHPFNKKSRSYSTIFYYLLILHHSAASRLLVKAKKIKTKIY